MIGYIDASAVLRSALAQPGAFGGWAERRAAEPFPTSLRHRPHEAARRIRRP